MAAENDITHGEATCAVEVSPEVVDAGAELTLKGTVTCVPPCDLRGQSLLIRDADGEPVGGAELTEYDGEYTQTIDFTLTAPVKAGAYTWLAVCPAHVTGGVAYAEASTPLSFTVVPHATTVVGWDVPSAIEAGKPFAMMVGVKCSRECNLTGMAFEIYDHEGKKVGAAALQGGPWKGTTALYHGAVELAAAQAVGLHKWTAKVPACDFKEAMSEEAIPHAEGSSTFGVRCVEPPQFVVKVEAFDAEQRTPLKGARVTIHPYRAMTDERGVAEVRVAKGNYKIFVSQTKYLSVGIPVEVTADVTTRAELHLEPPPERD